MNPVKPGINAFLLALSPISSIALSAPGAASAATLPSEPQSAASVTYQNAVVDSSLEKDAENLPGSASESDGFLARVRNGRINNLGVELLRTGMRTRKSDIRASFKIYAPMEKVNRALSVAKAIPGNLLDDARAAWIQTLLLAGKRQINTEFAYSIQLGSHGNFDSAITYRLNPDNGTGKSDMVASVRYSAQF